MYSPSKLYHYTTIETLALILKSKKLLFNRADLVNDRKECSSSDFGTFAQYVFLSCWSATDDESISLWNAYTKEMSGVRIELPMPIFKIYKLDDIYDSIIPYSEIENQEKRIFILPSRDMLVKVEYTDKSETLSPRIVKSIGEFEGFQLTEMGTKKKTIWQYENEWRFRLFIFPIDTSLNSAFFPDKYNRLIEERVPPPITSYFVCISEESFPKMVVRFGPRMKPETIKYLEALIDKYNPTASIESSVLRDDIR